jgi:hypothetical protein
VSGRGYPLVSVEHAKLSGSAHRVAQDGPAPPVFEMKSSLAAYCVVKVASAGCNTLPMVKPEYTSQERAKPLDLDVNH